MVSHVTTVAFQGIVAVPVDVQVQIVPAFPKFMIVGLPDKAVNESTERVRAALHAAGLALPAKRIIVNLAPADLPKEGSHYDVPIALALGERRVLEEVLDVGAAPLHEVAGEPLAVRASLLPGEVVREVSEHRVEQRQQ